MWSTYAGGFSADPGEITGPHQREQYHTPGEWIRTRPFPDYEHVDALLVVYGVSVDDMTLSVDLGVRNWGPKPHPYWISIHTKPPDFAWKNAELVADERFRVGTDREAFMQVNTEHYRIGHTQETRRELAVELPTGYTREWILRAQVWSYKAGVRRPTDFHDETFIDPPNKNGVMDQESLCAMG